MPLCHLPLNQRIIGHDWVVRNALGLIVGQYRKRSQAEATLPKGNDHGYTLKREPAF